MKEEIFNRCTVGTPLSRLYLIWYVIVHATATVYGLKQPLQEMSYARFNFLHGLEFEATSPFCAERSSLQEQRKPQQRFSDCSGAGRGGDITAEIQR